jgi:hypothetical protein
MSNLTFVVSLGKSQMAIRDFLRYFMRSHFCHSFLLSGADRDTKKFSHTLVFPRKGIKTLSQGYMTYILYIS